MRLLRRLAPLPAGAPGYVAAIGGFDGIHLGHRALIGHARGIARREGLASMVLSFEPLPKEYFAAENPPARLTSLRERVRLLQADGPEVFCVLRFDARLRALGAAQFATLLASGGVRHVVIGHDFRAGYRGEATAEWFRTEGPAFGLAAEVLEPVMGEGIRIGSGAVRDALAAGNLALAGRLLGRPYSMRGRVVHGNQLGRQIGYPTANIRLARRAAPLGGIFAVRTRAGSRHPWLDAVASLGTRPTIGGREWLLEVHVFDFAGDLYGCELEVEFVARLRDELRFDNVEAMVEQIHRDAAAARKLLAAS